MTLGALSRDLVDWVRWFIAEHPLEVLGGLLGLILLQTFRLALSRSLAARRMNRHRRSGHNGEKQAALLLEKSGFTVVETQKSGSYQLGLDGSPMKVHLRADFLVTRRGKLYIAEVKSGAESAKISGRATRRQLLEYLFAFEVHGLLLVDMFDRSIHQVSFPSRKS